ncbi:hypothetical protein COU58_00495 [Candidatus Pacearchaeota archaeon CG10_big_fil_rev_8_21_14_0_10_32_42]|nr:MAG: hypothetical protein COU58_00495 [Candidatus Pacearchaeota archaeon CG10_big_fil_rev_8_21_14_0_10_32_42]
MESFCFSVSGEPHKIQKVYNKLKNFLNGIEYTSDSYMKTVLLPRGTSEIEVLDKKGHTFSFFKSNLSFYANLVTNFRRESGRTIGYNSRLSIKLHSHDHSNLIKMISSVSEIDPVLENKENYGFFDKGNVEFIDLL